MGGGLLGGGGLPGGADGGGLPGGAGSVFGGPDDSTSVSEAAGGLGWGVGDGFEGDTSAGGAEGSAPGPVSAGPDVCSVDVSGETPSASAGLQLTKPPARSPTSSSRPATAQRATARCVEVGAAVRSSAVGALRTAGLQSGVRGAVAIFGRCLTETCSRRKMRGFKVRRRGQTPASRIR